MFIPLRCHQLWCHMTTLDCFHNNMESRWCCKKRYRGGVEGEVVGRTLYRGQTGPERYVQWEQVGVEAGTRVIHCVNWEDNCLHSCVHTVPPKCCKLLQRSYAYAGVSVTKISVNQYDYMHLSTRMHGAWPMLIKTLWYQPSRVAAAMAHCCSDNDISVILVARLNYPSFEATPDTNYSWLN